MAQNEINMQKKLANKTDSSTVSYKHRTGRILVQIKTRDAFPAPKTRKEGFRKVFNVWAKSHFSNFKVG